MNPQTVPPAVPDPDRARFYTDDAAWYVKQLPLEHFMESTAQHTQSEITEASFRVVRAARPDVHLFGELLVQYPVPGKRRPGRVVPDNFVVVHPMPIDADGSYPIELMPARPLLVIEYVSKGNPRKDYDDNMTRYERALRVPYYLMFYPDNVELSLFHLDGKKYRSVGPDAAGRYAVPELELELGLLGGWVRYWFRGRLVQLPEELDRRAAAAEGERDAERAARLTAETRAETAETRATTAETRAETAERERDAERAARAAADAEIARLRDALGRAGGGG